MTRSTTPETIGALLRGVGAGDRAALDRLLPIVYADLQRLARAQLRREVHRRTLDTAVLVHEAYLKLVDRELVTPADRSHFLAICARAMRQVIVDRARKRQAAKRGGRQDPVTLDAGQLAADSPAAELLALDQALGRLEARSPRLARVVECRFFAGLTEEETAAALGVTSRTVQRDWLRARAWLLEQLRPGGAPRPPERR